MTAKRFELMSDDEVIIDNCSIADDGGKQIYWIVEYGQRVKVVELLNELAEENQAVKDIINELNSMDFYRDSALLDEYIGKIARILGVDFE